MGCYGKAGLLLLRYAHQCFHELEGPLAVTKEVPSLSSPAAAHNKAALFRQGRKARCSPMGGGRSLASPTPSASACCCQQGLSPFSILRSALPASHNAFGPLQPARPDLRAQAQGKHTARCSEQGQLALSERHGSCCLVRNALGILHRVGGLRLRHGCCDVAGPGQDSRSGMAKQSQGWQSSSAFVEAGHLLRLGCL